MKSLLKHLLKSAGYRISKIPTKESHIPYDQDGLQSIHNHAFMDDPVFTGAYQRGTDALDDGETFSIHWRFHIALWAANHAKTIGGDFVEAGVNKGFNSSGIMHALDWNSLNHTFYLLDTFGGIDSEYVTAAEREDGFIESNQKRLDSGFYTQDFEGVCENFSEWDRVKIIKGSVPKTLDEIDSQRIAFLHLDMNCSPPEVATLEYLWDRMPTGAVVLMDDYAYWGFDSIKEGADEFAKSKGLSIASLPTGQGILLKP